MEEAERLVAERGKSQLTRPRDSFVTNRPSQAVTRWEMEEMGDGRCGTDEIIPQSSASEFGGYFVCHRSLSSE
jgi:hypothetical protein